MAGLGGMLESMRSSTHVLIALAGASVFSPLPSEAAGGRPWLAVLCIVCAMAPDVLERLRRANLSPDFRVVLDPSAPDAEAMAEGIALAAWKAAEAHQTCRICLEPLPHRADGTRASPWFRLDAAKRSVTAGLHGNPVAVERSLPPLRSGWPDCGVLEIEEPLMLAFQPGRDRKQALQCTMLERGWPHGLPFTLLVVAGLRLLWGAIPAMTAAFALGLHLWIDQGGFLGVPWLAPIRPLRPAAGWRWWRGDSMGANAACLWASGVFLFGNLARHTSYLPWRPSPAVLLTAALLPAGILLHVANARVQKTTLPASVRSRRLPSSRRRALR